jgi:aspartyl-tRNA(Asn)/glutamyl-tRNA(Gln) amidotransferase subunit C
MALSAHEVRWIAHLARLELSDAEVSATTGQLGAILDYVGQLQVVDVDGIEPLAHPFESQNQFRADEPTPSLPAEAALANAPHRQGNYFSVPAVLG